MSGRVGASARRTLPGAGGGACVGADGSGGGGGRAAGSAGPGSTGNGAHGAVPSAPPVLCGVGWSGGVCGRSGWGDRAGV